MMQSSCIETMSFMMPIMALLGVACIALTVLLAAAAIKYLRTST